MEPREMTPRGCATRVHPAIPDHLRTLCTTEVGGDQCAPNCRFVEADESLLRGAEVPVLKTHAHLFSQSPVFVSRHDIHRVEEIIRDVASVVALPPYLETIRKRSPAIAGFDPGAKGAFFGYDFHLGPNGPQLIEINTNAGGALFNVHLARAQEACCPEVGKFITGTFDPAVMEEVFVAMFRNEWSLRRPGAPLRSVAIVDESPATQPMYPEFLLFQSLFERHGFETVIADPSELRLRAGALWVGRTRIDLVYNRLCDFYFESGENAVLKEAYLSRAAVITPHPRAHAVYADKRNLTLLSNVAILRNWGVSEPVADSLTGGIPATVPVTPEDADQLWARRRSLFFKPATGYGSRGAYRGAKLTRRVWETIVAGEYVAQAFVPPSEQEVITDEGPVPLKVDLRAYTYDDEIQLLATRLYRGQTTNLRTPGGGFAPVFTALGPGADGDESGYRLRHHTTPPTTSTASGRRPALE